MKTQNLCYTNLENLRQYIELQRYSVEKNLLVQIFTSDLDNSYLSLMLDTLTSTLSHSVIIGATTDGEIYDGKSVSQKTILSFTTFQDVTVRAEIYDLNHSDFKVGRTIATNLYTKDTKALILFADGLTINGDDLLDGIYDVNKEIVIAGGLAGDYRRMQKTFVICNGEIRSNAVIACALNSKELIVNTAYVFGWRPIGKQMIVTKADGNRLYELDNEPLQNLYAKYLGENVAKALPVSAGEYPLIINRFGKQVARAALNLLEDGSMLYAGNFKIGDKVKFGYGHIPLILSDANHILENISDIPIESIFIYSCSARKYFMRDEVNAELALLEYLGGMSGFFTYGEFFHGSQKNELLNETMTMLLLSETSQTEKKKIKKTGHKAEKNDNQPIFNTLFHLIQATSNELSNTNEMLETLVNEKTKQLREKIYYESLTKLPNRNFLLENFNYQSTFIPTMIAIINIDDFKKVNDYYGYKIGDMVLLKVAEQIHSVIESKGILGNCVLYKFPVDEFSIAANSAIGSMEFNKIVDDILAKLLKDEIVLENDHFFLDYTVGVSLGRAESEDYLEEIDGVLLQANMALRQAKDTKTQKVIYQHDSVIRKQLESNLLWTKKIKEAISEDRFIPYFQPIYSSKNGEIEKYECLVRMIDTDNKIISPVAFLEVAKKSKLYASLTCVMVKKCFNVFARNMKNFSINVSVADIQNPQTMSFMKSQIEHYGIGKQLTFEILESEDIRDYDELSLFIKNMKEFGCRIAIDDFGSGYSNFQHIIMMDIDFLKIDGSLIKNINRNIQNKLMVEMIIDFCKKANIYTVAEFVSDKEIYETMKALGVDYMQGYYLGEPTANC